MKRTNLTIIVIAAIVSITVSDIVHTICDASVKISTHNTVIKYEDGLRNSK